MNLEKKLKKGKFVITTELEPPKGFSLDRVLEEISSLGDKIDAFNVTDMQASRMRMSPWALSIVLKNKGYEPILQLTARDRNILALEGDLLGCYYFGIRNILMLGGDNPATGDHPFVRGVFEVDSIKMAEIASSLNRGYDIAGNPLENNEKTSFFIGAALNPFSSDINKEIAKAKAKIEAGVSFFQTQPVFDTESFIKFLKKASLGVPVLAGIMFLKSFKFGTYLNKNIPGVNIPLKFLERIKQASSVRQEAVTIALEIASAIKEASCGIHIMPFGWYKETDEFLKEFL